MARWYRWDDDTLVLSVRAQPRASRDAFGDVLDDSIKVHTTAPPVDGAANTQIANFLAKQFGVAKRNVELVKGEKSRVKIFRIKSPCKLPSSSGLEWNQSG